MPSSMHLAGSMPCDSCSSMKKADWTTRQSETAFCLSGAVRSWFTGSNVPVVRRRHVLADRRNRSQLPCITFNCDFERTPG
jgi:hypothetical protein